jgi:serine/threonine protein kinase
MSTELMSRFLEGLHTSRLLDNDRLEELLRRPEPPQGDLDGVAKFLEGNGWLTRYQIAEIREGRGHALTFAGYRLLERLPDAPGGSEFKAFHPALQQAVVVRWVSPDWLAPADEPKAYIERAQKASLVSHRNIVNTLDAGFVGETAFIVRELVDGAELGGLVNEMGALPVPLACAYARQAAEALQAAHERGVCHGDFAPEHMLLTPVIRKPGVNGSGRAVGIRPAPGAAVKVAELGLVPRRPPLGELSFGQSHLLGSVAYAAPERLTAAGPDVPGDLYSLGAALYFLLAARSPLPAKTPADALLQLQQAEPVPIEALRNDLPPAVADLIRRLLTKDPAGRPASAAEVIAELQPHGTPGISPTKPAAATSAVPVAHETGTVPNALPSVMTRAPHLPDDDALHQPTVEPLPDDARDSQVVTPRAPRVEPLPEDDHHDPFGVHHGGAGDSSSAVPLRRREAPKKGGWSLLIFAVLLHVIAIGVLIAYIGNFWPFEQASSTSEDEPKTEKQETPKKVKKRDR